MSARMKALCMKSRPVSLFQLFHRGVGPRPTGWLIVGLASAVLAPRGFVPPVAAASPEPIAANRTVRGAWDLLADGRHIVIGRRSGRKDDDRYGRKTNREKNAARSALVQVFTQPRSISPLPWPRGERPVSGDTAPSDAQGRIGSETAHSFQK